MFFIVSGEAEMVMSREHPTDAADRLLHPQQPQQQGGAAAAAAGRPAAARPGGAGAQQPQDRDEAFRDSIAIATLGEFEVFGEAAFVYGLEQPFSVRTAELCRVLFIRADSWKNMATSHASDARMVCELVYDRVKESSQRPGLAPEVEAMYAQLVAAIDAVQAQQCVDQVGQLCLAAAGGDMFAMQRALAGGFDPNLSDYDGRTARFLRLRLRCGGGSSLLLLAACPLFLPPTSPAPLQALHVAAAKGESVSVRYLLDHGARVNCVDSLGNTPLFEAVRNGHQMAASMLLQEGASLGLTMAGLEGEAEGTTGMRDAGTVVCQACNDNNVKLLFSLLENGLGARTAGGPHGRLPACLHACAVRGKSGSGDAALPGLTEDLVSTPCTHPQIPTRTARAGPVLCLL